MVFVHPVFERALHEVLGSGAVVVPVKKPGFWTGRYFVEPRVICRRLEGIGVPIHFQERVGVIGVVEHHIQNHRNAPFVACIHEGLERLLVAVSFVQCEVKRGVVSPAIVPVEFVNGHEFDGIDAQSIEVIQCVQNRLVIAFVGEVPNKQFVDHQRRLLGSLEFIITPIKRRRSRLQHRNRRIFREHVREGWHVGIGCFWNPLVVPRVQHQFGVGVSDAHIIGHDVVMESLQFTGFKSFNFNPVLVAVGGLGHEVVEAQLPIVEVPDYEYKLLSRRMQLKKSTAG